MKFSQGQVDRKDCKTSRSSVLSLTWIFCFLLIRTSSCLPLLTRLLSFMYSRSYIYMCTPHHFLSVPSGWRLSSAGWALTTKLQGSSFIDRWPPWGAVLVSAIPLSSNTSRPKTSPRRRPTSCACPPSTWRWSPRLRRSVSLKLEIQLE